ncbi:MAG: Na+:solute symporter [Kiritimatiellae bacterium]|nr:Na+:solute symporter [Kiritimatiellia bacterium]
MLLNGYDWAVIAAFFVLLALIPTLASLKSRGTAGDFFNSGHSMPWWLIGFSMVAATTATDSANFFTEVIRRDGMGGNWIVWAFILTGLLTVFVYAKLWVKSGVSTDIEFYELRYSGRPAAFLRAARTLYLGVVFNVLVLGNVILAAVKIGVVLFGIEPNAILAVTVAASIVYTFFGGIRGVIWTDFFLFLVVMAGAVAAMVYGLRLPEVGGMAGIVANPETAKRLSIMPDFGSWDSLLVMFVIPIAVQWWNVWKAGSEPGGGGYIVQRMLTAKSDNHALGGTLFFNILNWVVRPWPWYIVGLCSVIVYPDLASIKAAFPKVDPSLVQGDMAYPAMLTKVPHLWLGVVAASMMGALFSTVAAHLNLGSAYVVNDFWKRFVRPQAKDRELIWVGRASMLALLLLGCWIAPRLKSAKAAFDLMLLIGAGSGSVFLLRWFWMRINAWTEIVGMGVSFAAALVLQFGFPWLLPWQKMLTTIAVTSASWLAVTFLTKPTEADVAARFRAAVRAEGRDVGRGVLLTAIAAFAVYDMMYAVGAWIYGWTAKAAVATALAVAASGVVVHLMRKTAAVVRK